MDSLNWNAHRLLNLVFGFLKDDWLHKRTYKIINLEKRLKHLEKECLSLHLPVQEPPNQNQECTFETLLSETTLKLEKLQKIVDDANKLRKELPQSPANKIVQKKEIVQDESDDDELMVSNEDLMTKEQKLVIEQELMRHNELSKIIQVEMDEFFLGWKLEKSPLDQTPQQFNSIDCGIFCIMLIESIKNNIAVSKSMFPPNNTSCYLSPFSHFGCGIQLL